MITIRDGDVYQWDSGRQVEVDSDVCEVHFASCNSKDAYVTVPVDGVCNIPNILLQSGEDFVIYAVCQKDECEQTVEHLRVWIKQRAKPSDYVYTETEVFDYKQLEERIKTLEKSSGGDTGVSDVTVNGASIVSDGVANLPIAKINDDVYGLVKLNSYQGIGLKNGYLTFNSAGNWYIDNRNTSMMCAITPNNMDYTVKQAMTDGKGQVWTSEEKASARERMGLEWSTVCDITLNEDTDIFELKDIECSELHIQVIGKISTRRVQIMLNNTNPQLYFDNAILTRDSDLTILDITISKRHDSDVCICTTKSSGTTTSGFHFSGTNYSATFKRNYDMINKLKLFLFSDGVATESVFRQGCRIVVYGR